jgi:hypothetical protein
MKIKYIEILQRDYWEGDELRGEDNIRSGIFKHFYVKKDDYYKVIKQAKTFHQIFEEVIREELKMSWGRYTCEILEGAEDGNEELIKLHNELVRKAKGTIKDTIEFECEASYPLGTKVPEGYIEVKITSEKLYLTKEVGIEQKGEKNDNKRFTG